MANSTKKILLALQKQALSWTILGFGVLVFYPIIIFNWDKINELNLLFTLGIIGVSGSIVWWFWTMCILFQLLRLRREEAVTFHDILKEIKSIRKDLDNNKTK
jgi:hypothetical protein